MEAAAGSRILPAGRAAPDTSGPPVLSYLRPGGGERGEMGALKVSTCTAAGVDLSRGASE